MDFKCLPCSRSFNSQNALQQHKRFSAAHVFDCATCDRHFRSGRALEQHYENSRAHNRIVDWDDCDRSFFSTQEASNQYGLDIKCETRGRVFDDDKALERHLTNSHEHGTTTTPLDDFFRSFPNFDYDPSLPPATSYANLRSHKWWRRGDAALDGAWKRYQAALESELLFWYGAENDLNAWHTLCRAMGIEPLPQTCWQCKKVGRLQTSPYRSILI